MDFPAALVLLVLIITQRWDGRLSLRIPKTLANGSVDDSLFLERVVLVTNPVMYNISFRAFLLKLKKQFAIPLLLLLRLRRSLRHELQTKVDKDAVHRSPNNSILVEAQSIVLVGRQKAHRTPPRWKSLDGSKNDSKAGEREIALQIQVDRT